MNRRMSAALAAALLIGTGTFSRADIVFLNKGEEVRGAVEGITPSEVRVRAKDGSRVFPKSEIQKVKLVKEWRLEGEDTVGRIKDPSLKAFLKSPPKPEDFPEDGYLIVLQEKTYVLNKDGGFSKTVRSIRHILKERGKDKAGNVRAYYLDGLQKARIDYARSITGEAVDYLDDTSVQDASEFYYYPGYDRLRSVKFSVPNVNIGSTLDYSYTVETSPNGRDYPFYGEMYFRTFEPVKTFRLSVVVPKGTKLRIETAGLPEDFIYNETRTEDAVRRTWTVTDADSYRKEDHMPPYRRLAPRVRFCVDDDWGDIRREFARKADARSSGPELKAKVREVAQGLKGDAAAEALYNWVAKEIKYAAIDMPAYGYTPKSPDEILRAKMGNALDKPYLLYAMTKEAGLDATFVYLSDKNAPPVSDSLPSIRQFTTGGVLLRLKDRELFVSPLSDTRRWTELPGVLQDVSGLRLSDDQMLLYVTPLLERERESAHSRSRLKVSPDGSVAMSTEMHFEGKEQAAIRGLKHVKKAELDRIIEQIVHRIHPNAKAGSYEIANLSDLSKDIVFKLAFTIDDYALRAGEKLLVLRIPGLEHPARDVGKPKRELPLFWRERSLQSNQVTIEIPKGYSVHYLPERVELVDDAASYRARYLRKAGSVVFEELADRGAVGLPTEGYPAYKALRERMAKYAQEWIVLRATD